MSKLFYSYESGPSEITKSFAVHRIYRVMLGIMIRGMMYKLGMCIIIILSLLRYESSTSSLCVP